MIKNANGNSNDVEIDEWIFRHHDQESKLCWNILHFRYDPSDETLNRSPWRCSCGDSINIPLGLI